jgi:eukaryotic-like serine/threonine-protein kinase
VKEAVPPYDEPTEEFERPGAPAAEVVERPFMSAGVQLRAGRYELDRLLGRGGMAAVWRARDRRLERPVAIKVLSDTLACDSGYLARFEREARVAAGLTHPNLIRIYDYGAERGRPFLVMEYVDGGDLAARLAAGRPPDPDRIARELLAAIRHMHGAGVLHRDVKAQNVLLGRDGGSRLTDFGIAQPADATSLTQPGMVVGTARYLAPEVLEGGAPSERSDLYSLGVLLADVAAARPGRPALADLIAALRADDPAIRPRSAAVALAQLERPARPLAPTRGFDGLQHPELERSLAGRHQPAPAGGLDSRLAGETRPAPAGGPRLRLVAIAAAAMLILGGLAGGVVLGTGGDEAVTGSAAELAPGERSAGGDGDGAGPAGASEDAGPARGNGGGERSGGGEPDRAVDGFALNDQGFALINDGQPSEAVPLLRRAVDALEGSGDINYAYALFNLGRALRLSGHPEEAIPILEARLEIPNQRGVVRRELEAARAGATMSDERGGAEPN